METSVKIKDNMFSKSTGDQTAKQSWLPLMLPLVGLISRILMSSYNIQFATWTHLCTELVALDEQANRD